MNDPAVRVLALTRYDRLGASSRLRTFQYKEPLARLGVDLQIVPLFGDDYVRALYQRRSRARLVVEAMIARARAVLSSAGHDVLWVEKEFLPWLPAFFELGLLPKRTRLVVDCDDAVFHRYDMHHSPLVRRALGRKLDAIMARADLVVAGNRYLADRAAAAGARSVEIVPTVVDLARYQPRSVAPRDAVTIGWIGSPKTANYLDPIKPVLQDLATGLPLRAVAIGARPDQVSGSCFEPVPWSEEAEVDELRRFDIGIMPLADTPWERGKCGYKLIQYMALGLPVVASPIGVNSQIVRHGVNGYLASSPEEWSQALGLLATDPALRASFGAAGRRDVEERFSLAVEAPRLASLIRAVAGRSVAPGRKA